MKAEKVITVYSPAKTETFFSTFFDIIKGFKAGRGLGVQLARRDLSAMYRQSVFGILWAVVTPLAQTMVWVFLSNRGVLNVGDTGVAYPLYVLSGIMLWQTFMECINSPLMMFNGAKTILRKINMNKEALIIGGFLKVSFNLAIKLLVLIPLMIYFDLTFGLGMLWAIVAIFLVMVFGFAIGILLTPIGALYTDVQRFIQTFSQLFFFLTPIIYPARVDGVFGLMDTLNPAVLSICSARDLLLGTADIDLTIYLGFNASVFLLLFFGLILYRVSLPIIVERMGS